MTVQLLPTMVSSAVAPPAEEGALHPSVVSGLLDGDLSADELNEIPTLPGMEECDFAAHPTDGSMILDEQHPATQIALAASALDGALGCFEFLPAPTTSSSAPDAATPVSSVQTLDVYEATDSGMVSDDSDGSVDLGKRPSATKTTDQESKKRRVSTESLEVVAVPSSIISNLPQTSSPVTSPRLSSVNPPPTLVSPMSSVSGSEVVVKPVDPTKDSNTAKVQLPQLPDCTVSSSTMTPLLPRPPETTSAPVEEDASVQTTSSPPSSSTPTSTNNKRAPLKVDPLGPVNTSTEYIQMLTSESGAAECAKMVTCNLPSTGGRSGRQKMTAAERAQASRDRNREHARNTRLRKKAYVEELKRTLLALAEERDAVDLEEESGAKVKEEQRKVRLLVLQELLRMTGTNCQDTTRWAAILMPTFSLRTPTLRSDDSVQHDKTLVGVNQVMDNAGCLSGFLQTVGGRGVGLVTLNFDTSGSTLFMDGSNVVLEWEATSVGATANGASDELAFHGSIKARFDPESNKILSAAMLFDTGSVLAQKRSVASS